MVQLSGRAAAQGGAAYPLSHLSDLMVGLQGTDFRVPSPYLGALGVALAVVGARVWWKRAEVKALVAVVVVGLVLTYQSPLYSLLQHAPLSGRITWNRDVMLLGLAVAVLGAVGLDSLVRGEERALARRWALGAFGISALVVGVVSAGGGGRGAAHHGRRPGPLGGGGGRDRGGTGPGGVGHPRRGRPWPLGVPGPPAGPGGGVRRPAERAAGGARGVVLVDQLAAYFAPTPAVAAHPAADGGHRHGGHGAVPAPALHRPRTSTEPGIRPNANVGYGVHEFAVYEPVLPNVYYRSWTAVSGRQVRLRPAPGGSVLPPDHERR